MTVSATNVLGDRAVRYKRNVLAASLIITVLYWTNASLGDASFFGVSLPDAEGKDGAAWVILAAIHGYQVIMLAYYGWTDWQIWQREIKATYHFSPSTIVRGIKEGDEMWEQGTPSNSRVTQVTRRLHATRWVAQAGELDTKHHRDISRGDIQNIRWRLGAFLTFEFGAPFLWGLVSLVFALLKIFGEAPAPPECL